MSIKFRGATAARGESYTDSEDMKEAARHARQLIAMQTDKAEQIERARAGSLSEARTKRHSLPVSVPCIVEEFASQSQHGARHGTINQDAVFCERTALAVGEVVVAAVFDGHGILGETAAAAAVARMKTIVGNKASMNTAVTDGKAWMTWVFEQLQEAVEVAHRDAPKEYTYPGKAGSKVEYKLENVGGRFGMAYTCQNESMPVAPIDFGTTAAVAIVVGNVITTGFLGDADVIMCSCDSAEIPGRCTALVNKVFVLTRWGFQLLSFFNFCRGCIQ